MSGQIAWGIVGLGNIARKFAADLALVPGGSLRAVASRDLEKARSFAGEFRAEKAYGSYAELFEDPTVSAVYIASPHSFHKDHTRAALLAGKHVLCEKPLGINAREVGEVVALAREQGLFLMEALWSRFNPSIRAVYQRVRAGELGPLAYLRADFSFPALDRDPAGRLLNPALAGGSLLDIGIYPVFLAYLMLGIPRDIKVLAHFHETGAEKQIALLFDYPGAMAVLYSGFASRSEMKAELSCREGSIYLNPRWHQAETYSIEREGEFQEFRNPLKGNGYTYEIEEVHACLQAGKTQSDLWSWHDSRELHALLDRIRARAGITFPGEA